MKYLPFILLLFVVSCGVNDSDTELYCTEARAITGDRFHITYSEFRGIEGSYLNLDFDAQLYESYILQLSVCETSFCVVKSEKAKIDSDGNIIDGC